MRCLQFALYTIVLFLLCSSVGQAQEVKMTFSGDTTYVFDKYRINFLNSNKNVFVGRDAGRNIDTAQQNTALGHMTLATLKGGKGNVAIGYQAGYNEMGSNKLYIENSNSSTPLIYGEFDNDVLRINGELQVMDKYKFPTTSGFDGQVLKTDHLGQLSFQNDEVDDADSDPGNERIDSVSFDFPILGLWEGGIPTFIDLGILYADDDPDPQNEIQDLELTFDSLRISGGTGIKWPTPNKIEDGDFDTQIGLFESTNDLVGFTVDGKDIVCVDSLGIRFYNNRDNTLIGLGAGARMQTGSTNTYIGSQSGKLDSVSTGNTFLGYQSGAEHKSGNNNTFIGQDAGGASIGGSGNVAIGHRAGLSVGGSGNVFIGNDAGSNRLFGSNQLYIENTDTNDPLIYGEFDSDYLEVNGNMKVLRSTFSPTVGDFVYSGPIGDGDEQVIAVRGYAVPGDHSGIGGRFQGGFIGVDGYVESTGDQSYYGAVGSASGGAGANHGVYGYADSEGAAFGVYGICYGDGEAQAIGVFGWGIPEGGGIAYGLYANGDIGYTGALINASDSRLKHSISNLESATETIMRLEPKSYKYRKDEYTEMNLAEGVHYGFLAQDLEEVLPELVHNGALKVDPGDRSQNDEAMKGVNYIELIPILTKAIQEQQEMIQDLELRIQQLENE